jgi:uncharacterized membrane protein
MKASVMVAPETCFTRTITSGFIYYNSVIMLMNLKEFSIKLADKIAEFIGSWTFIVIQSTILTIWVIANITGIVHFDPYPFILLNLFLSFEAAYATPLILMSSTRQGEKDREHLLHDLALDEEANAILRKLVEDIRIDKTALDYIIKAKEERAEMKELILKAETDRTEMRKNIEEIKKLLEK